MEAFSWVIVVVIVGILVLVIGRAVLKMVKAGADIAVATRINRELKDPQTSAVRLQEITKIVARPEPEFLPMITRHPNAYPELLAWIAEYRSARAGKQFDLEANLLNRVPTPPSG
jgi:hypothetical protein